MPNWTVTAYQSEAAAEEAMEALGNVVYAQIVPFQYQGNQYWSLVNAGAGLPTSLANNPLTTDLKLEVDSVPFGYDIAMGNIPGCSGYGKMGYNGDVDELEEDLWAVGGKYVFPTGPMKMEVVSSSTDDSANGTGARTVYIVYLDSTYTEKIEEVTLNGTNPVETVAADIYRINNYRVGSAGINGVAAGDIDIRHIDNSPIYSRISVGQTHARSAIYTVPKGKTYYITQLTYSVGSSTGAHFCTFTLRSNYDEIAKSKKTLFFASSEIGLQDNALPLHYDIPMKFTEGVDIRALAKADASAANAICTVQYRGFLKTNS